MKRFYKTLFSFFLLLSLSNGVTAHTVQVAYCVSCNGDLRIFFEHWHGTENPNTTTMTISLTIGVNTTTQTASPAGSIMNTPLNSLPGCTTPITVAASCSQANTYNDWVWFDYTGLPCNTPITFTVVSGNTVFTSDGCGMYPLSVTFNIPCGTGTLPDMYVCDGQPTNPVVVPVGTTWTNNNPSIGLPASGSGNIPSFTPIGPTATATISYSGSCITGTFNIYVNPNPVAAFSAPSVCIGTATTFTNQSTGGTSWNWNFGDGNSSTQQNPAPHTYTASGTYNVTLTVTGTGGCNSTVTQTVTVNPQPVANFSATTVCLGNPTQFTDQSTGGGTSWSWNFGDATSSTQQSPSHIYSAPGNYTVTLTVTAPGGCMATISIPVTVYPQPVAAFSANTPVCLGNPIQFTDQSTGGGTSWNWNFGNGNTSTQQSPSYTYTASGTYTVTLIVTASPGGCNSTATQIITVNIQPVAAFSVTTVCFGNPTQFTDQSTGGGTSWSWNFGDATSSTQQSPSHTYSIAGSYTATLTVTGPGGCNSTFVQNVTVFSQALANFTAPPVCLNTPPTQFTDLSTNTSTWNWNFGDPASGGNNISAQQNPSHNYSVAGTYSVTLMVASGNGCADTITQIITVNPAPTAAFSVTTVCFNNATVFTDLSGGNPTSWNWSFPGGNPSSSTSQNPAPTYNGPGTYTATLISTNANGCQDTTSMAVVVHPLPMANFSATTVCVGTSTCFNDLTTISSGTITGWSWNFGDPSSPTNISNVQNPCHVFTGAGNYMVILTSTSNNGCQNTINLPVTVNSLPVAAFSANDVCLNALTIFTNSSINSVQWNWSFGDSYTSTQQNPSHTYLGYGTYVVTLIVSSAAGCKDTVMDTLTVYPLPVVNFTADSVCVGEITSFTDLSFIPSGNISTWNWNFSDPASGGNNTSAQQNPTHVFTAPSTPSTFNVSLTATSDKGCVSTVSIQVIVHPLPAADFSFQPASPIGLTDVANFNDLSTDAVQWYWLFGDDSSSILQSPSHLYGDTGTYMITLAVVSEYGCVDTIEHPLKISDYTFYIPTAFTPNNDGTNDFFFGVGIGIVEYEMWIFDRWGNRIFYCKVNDLPQTPPCMWDGKVDGGISETRVQQDAYVWKVHLTNVFAKEFDFVGIVMVVK